MRRHARRQLNDLNHVRLTQDFEYEPLPTRLRGAEQAHHPVAQLVHPLRHVDGRHSRGARTVRGRVLVAWSLRVSCPETPPLPRPPLLTAPAPDVGLVGLPITWGATRVAQCAGESDERGSPSRSFR